MNEPHDPNETFDASSAAADSLDAGLAAGFGRRVDGPASVLSALGSTLGSLRPVLLKEAQGESALVVKPGSDAMPSKEETGDRYQLSGEIARGGMGAVLRGRDVDLGRDLAVKVLLEKYVDRPEVARRFIEEAQIGGPVAASGRGAGVRHRPVRRPAVFHHEAGERADAFGAPGGTHRGGRGSAAAAGHRLAGGAGGGVCPRQGGDPPRLEAGEHHGGGVRRGAGDGLGAGQGAGRGGRRR